MVTILYSGAHLENLSPRATYFDHSYPLKKTTIHANLLNIIQNIFLTLSVKTFPLNSFFQLLIQIYNLLCACLATKILITLL